MSLSVNRISGYQQNRKDMSFGRTNPATTVAKVKTYIPNFETLEKLRDNPLFLRLENAIQDYNYRPTMTNKQRVVDATNAYKNSSDYN